MRVTFETASFADSIKNAAIVAPGSGGSTFDKANGIVLDLDSEGKEGWNCLVRSTNLDIYRMEWVDPEKIEGTAERWRLPAKLFAQVLSSLPIGTGKTVTLTSGISGLQRFVRIESGRTKARFNLIDAEYYPDWPIFDPSMLTEALDIGARIGQIEWAADSAGQPPYSGVHFDGSHAIATDRYRIAVVPLEIPGLAEPITVPSGMLSQLLKRTGEIKLGVDGSQLLLMPDDAIQLRCVLFGDPYPNTSKIQKLAYPNEIKVKKTLLLEIMQRAASYAASDRDSVMRCFIGEEEFAVMASNQEIGVIGDAITIPGQATHARFEVKFTPKNIMDLLTNAPSEEVTISYTLGEPNKVIRVDGGSGYYAWGMPRASDKRTQPEE